MEGWIKLHRAFIEWEWFDEPNMVKLFLYILLRANHKDSSWKSIELKRGQFITGLNKLSEATGISMQSLRTCLKRLESTGEINRQTNNQYSIITVCKYDTYQHEETFTNKPDNKRLTSNQQTTNKQLTTDKNNKNNKNNKNVNNLESRINTFKKQVFEHTQYSSEMLESFFMYWAEHNEGGKKMKFEMQKTFNVTMRLATWNKREKNFSGSSDKKQEMSDYLKQQYNEEISSENN